MAARKVRLQQRAEDGDERAKAALALAHDPNKFLSTVQFGITMVGVLAGAYGGATIGRTARRADRARCPQLAPYAEGIALGLVVIGDHRAVADHRRAGAEAHRPQQSRSDRVVGGAADDDAVAHRRAGRRAADRVHQRRPAGCLASRARRSRTSPKTRSRRSSARAPRPAPSASTEENIVQRVFQLGDQRVASIMTPRPDIEWIDVDASEEELREFLASHSHTQFVVCHGGLDEVLGIVRSADLLPLAFKGARIDLRR